MAEDGQWFGYCSDTHKTYKTYRRLWHRGGFIANMPKANKQMHIVVCHVIANLEGITIQAWNESLIESTEAWHTYSNVSLPPPLWDNSRNYIKSWYPWWSCTRSHNTVEGSLFHLLHLHNRSFHVGFKWGLEESRYDTWRILRGT